jgi:predicted DsbA family dithiol-disulfide isomerase
VLESDAYAEDVRSDLREGRELGVSGVPFFVVDRRYGISGAQETDRFLEVLHHARNEQTVAASPGR